MKTVCFTLLLCLASPLRAALAASPAADAQAAIQAIYARQDTAIARKDEAGVLTGCAPDYREVHTESKVHGMSFNVAHLRPMIHSMLFFAKTASRKTTIKEIDYASGGVTVTVQQHMVLWMPVPKKHKYAQIFINTTSADTWVKSKKGWQEKQSLVLSGQTVGYLHSMATGKKRQKPRG